MNSHALYTISFVALSLAFASPALAQSRGKSKGSSSGRHYTVHGDRATDQAAAKRAYNRERKAMREGDRAGMKDAVDRYYEESGGLYRGFKDGASGVRRVERGLPVGREVGQLSAAEHKDLYQGVIPKTRDEVSGVGAAQGRVLGWVGFLAEDERTRVFLKVSEDVTYEKSSSDDGAQITLTLPGAKLGDRNAARRIDASFFGRAVETIEVKRKNKQLEVILTVKKGASAAITRDQGYLFIDFARAAEDTADKG